MASDEPSEQLHAELRAAVQNSLGSRRPVLHHLNADTSWLLQIPRPESAVRNGGRFYYNVLIDPWFQGTQTDFAAWFSRQWHATKSAVGSIAELEELAWESEVLTAELRTGSSSRKSNAAVEHEQTFIDALVISHEFTDHCHKETLLEVNADVPVFATKEALKVIQGWKHFRSTTLIDVFGVHGDTDWRGTSSPPLPAWIGIGRLLQKRDMGNLHSALLITFNNRHARTKPSKAMKPAVGRTKRHEPIVPNEDEEAAEAIIYTPHGIASSDLTLLPEASPPIHTLALLHGLHNVRLGGAGRAAMQINLGAKNGLEVQRLLRADYWIGTHDEIKDGKGLVGWLLRRDDVTYGDAVKKGWKDKDGKSGNSKKELSEVLSDLDGTNWVELRNGESKVLTVCREESNCDCVHHFDPERHQHRTPTGKEPKMGEYDDVEEWDTAKPRSSKVSIGTHSLHVSVSGPQRQPGDPIVIVLPGLTSSIVEWSATVDHLSPYVRTLAYERAGYGLSDQSPTEPTAEQIAAELDDHLATMDVGGPYLLVAHSWGGIIAREFIHRRGAESIHGVVFVDANTEDTMSTFPNATVRTMSKGLDTLKVCYEAAHALSSDQWQALLVEEASEKHDRTAGREVEQYAASGAQLAAKCEREYDAGLLGERPVSVIQANYALDLFKTYRAGLAVGNGTDEDRVEMRRLVLTNNEDDERMERKLLNLSSCSRYIKANHSGHSVHMVDPELIAEEVKWVLASSTQAKMTTR
ncbi:hypothetical protein LTR56_019135 [Elasticomyces elasticus]|nr:hypothetical protein LTR56_019135 [Elasticomyces elasticus]KAK4911508.1 hypothetical protein LTR49_019919 [Elasticomyces elasticus]KAK5751069.1 hypothetical protein LTS12_018879 [Elasticomyces elasticus]